MKRRKIVKGRLWCPRCACMVALGDFDRNRADPTGYASWCRPCRAEARDRKLMTDAPKCELCGIRTGGPSRCSTHAIGRVEVLRTEPWARPGAGQ